MADAASVGDTSVKLRSRVKRSNTSAKEKFGAVFSPIRWHNRRRSFSLESLNNVGPVSINFLKKSSKSQVDLVDGKMTAASPPYLRELKHAVGLRNQTKSPTLTRKVSRTTVAVHPVDLTHQQFSASRKTLAVESSYSALPIRDYANEIGNVPPSTRKTVDFTPSLKILEPKTFEKATKVTVDGKSTKIGKNEILKLENNRLVVSDEKGNVKVFVQDFSIYQEQPTNSSKDLLYTYQKSVIKIHIENTEIIETKTILQRLLGRRLQYAALERKGIAKNEAVFGNTLENISLREKRDVPEFVTKITRLLESPKNITSSGIYRTSGNVATIQKIRCKVDLHKLSILDDYKEDADVLAGTLKMFFRELKDSIVGIEQYNALCEILGGRLTGHKRKGLMRKFADKNSPHSDTFLATIEVIQSLSKPKRETIEHLMRHLLRVISHESENSMSLKNISICWGPSFINLDVGNNKEEVLANAQKKNSIVELLLRSYKHFENQQRPSGSRLSLTNERPSLERMDSSEGLHIKWSSMTALNVDNNINEDFVKSLMHRIETHKDLNKAYQKIEGGKMAAKIMRKLNQKSSKTLPRLLDKAKIEELCMLLKFCYDDQLITTIGSSDYTNLVEIRGELSKKYNDKAILSLVMYEKIRPLAKKQILFKQYVTLFAHFHWLMNTISDPTTKLQEISVFWCKTICGHETNVSLPLIFDIIDAFKETDWIEVDYEENETRNSTNEICLRPSKSASAALSLITEENGLEENSDQRALKCDDVVDCCTTRRPVTCAYTKADNITE